MRVTKITIAAWENIEIHSRSALGRGRWLCIPTMHIRSSRKSTFIEWNRHQVWHSRHASLPKSSLNIRNYATSWHKCDIYEYNKRRGFSKRTSRFMRRSFGRKKYKKHTSYLRASPLFARGRANTLTRPTHRAITVANYRQGVKKKNRNIHPPFRPKLNFDLGRYPKDRAL